MAKTLRYKDTDVAQGSDLWAMLTSNDPVEKEKAGPHYSAINKVFMKNYPPELHNILSFKIGQLPVKTKSDLKAIHGTPEEFEAAVNKAYDILTPEEQRKAIADYRTEWDKADE